VRRLAFGFLLAAWLAPGAANAGLFELYGQAHAGGGFGRGTAQAPSRDFFELVQGATVGGEIGIEVLYVDLFVDHYEFFDSKLKGSWTQFMLGMDAAFPLDDEHATEATVGVDAGLGVGTISGQSPLFSQETPVSHKGAAAELRLQGDRLLGKYAAIGLDLRMGYHYLFDATQPVNLAPTETQSHGFHFLGALAFKLHVNVL
jgi:hypothetical protein